MAKVVEMILDTKSKGLVKAIPERESDSCEDCVFGEIKDCPYDLCSSTEIIFVKVTDK